jgi:hypothetical protein
MSDQPTFDYESACRRAIVHQGLERFEASSDWTVEQTGGFTMVAFRHCAGGISWAVTMNGTEPGREYFAVCLPTSKLEEEGDDGEGYLAVISISLEDALALDAAGVDDRRLLLDMTAEEAEADILAMTDEEVRVMLHEQQHETRRAGE